jgi:hypothetical protein
MLAALLGFFGVLVGAVLTYLFSVSSEWRNRRLDTMVAVVTASTRVLGAHERLHGLFQGAMLRHLRMTEPLEHLRN